MEKKGCGKGWKCDGNGWRREGRNGEGMELRWLAKQRKREETHRYGNELSRKETVRKGNELVSKAAE